MERFMGADTLQTLNLNPRYIVEANNEEDFFSVEGPHEDLNNDNNTSRAPTIDT